MSGIFRRWLGGEAEPGRWDDIRRWAEGAGHRFALDRCEQGFVIDGRAGASGCRVEWGPSQRGYIEGQELRVRADVGPPADLQMLVATRELLGRLEREVFEQFTEGTETRIDAATPEEMRWVVLYPQVPGKVLGALRTRFGLLANLPSAATSWLEQGLAGPLASSAAWHDPAAPLVLVVQRGRFALRLAMAGPRIAVIDGAMTLGLAAAAAARRVAADVAGGAASTQRQRTCAEQGADVAP